MIEINLSESAGICINCTIKERKRVKKVKLAIKPIITPMGRDFPPTLDERIIGKTGKIQGERIVTIPARNAKAISKILYRLSRRKDAVIG